MSEQKTTGAPSLQVGQEIDWTDDEQVVRAAVPELQVSDSHDRLLIHERAVTFAGWALRSKAWSIARQHSTVQAFEAQHNPNYNKAAEESRDATDNPGTHGIEV